MPGKKYASIQNPAQYRSLRRQGMSKRRAAMISNGVTPGHTVKASATAPLVTPPHGPGGLLTTPGLGASSRRWGRRAGTRTKANYQATAGQTIAGNLKRGNDGKFTSAGGSSAPAKPATDRRPRAPGQGPKKPKAGGGRAPKAPSAAQQQREADRQADRQARIARQAQRDEERAADRAQRAADRLERRQQRMADRAQRQADRERKLAAQQQKKPKGGGGGKAPAAKPTEAERRAAQQAARAQTARDTATGLPSAQAIAPADVDALRQAANQGGAQSERLAALGLIGPDGMATDQGRRALTALELGKPAQYLAAVQDAAGRMDRERQAGERRTAAEAASQRRQQEAARRTAQALNRRAAQAARVSGARLKVYKDAQGRDRWVARTTTAYRDRDGEILSEAALDADSQRMTASGQYGPLRFWHLGRPDPTDPAAPWGPGVDLGDCDFSMQIGRTRVESGTFRDPAVARRIADTADGYELSPGFFHPPGEPRPGGVFTQIHTFERSLVPTAHGRASNLFTGLTVKEQRMDPKEEQRRIKVAAQTLGIAPELLAAGLAQTDKAAAERKIAFKEAAGLPVYELDGQPYVVRDGQLVALKAAMPPAEMVEAGETEAADGEMELADEAEDVSEFIGDMAPSDFRAMLRDEFAAAVQAMGAEIASKMAAMDEQLKGMGYARQKEAGAAAQVAERVAALETELKAAKAQLASLTDDSQAATRRGFRPSQQGADVDPVVAAKLKAQQAPAPIRTGDAAVDAVATWLAPDGSLPPIPGLGTALGSAQLFGINGAAPAAAGEE